MATNREKSLTDLDFDAMRVIIGNVDKIEKNLSLSCKHFYSMFRPQRNVLGIRYLLERILFLDNDEKVHNFFISNCFEWFFSVTSVQEHAAGIDEDGNACHRIVKTTPIRAMAATGDMAMLSGLLRTKGFKSHIDPTTKLMGAHSVAQQLKLQFPKDFKYPESTYDFSVLSAAISNDEELQSIYRIGEGYRIGKVSDVFPSQLTNEVLAQFRIDFNKKYTGIAPATGYFFNLNDLVRALEEYKKHEKEWSDGQKLIFWCQVVGYLQRFLSATDAHYPVLKQDDKTQSSKWVNSFELYNGTIADEMIWNKWLQEVENYYVPESFESQKWFDQKREESRPHIPTLYHFPLDSTPGYRLGENFGIFRYEDTKTKAETYIQNAVQILPEGLVRTMIDYLKIVMQKRSDDQEKIYEACVKYTAPTPVAKPNT